MAIKLKSTGDLSDKGLKVLVYGQAGCGKTTLSKTLPKPIVLSAEGGLLSLKDDNIPFIEIKSMDDLHEAYEWVNKSKDYESVVLDSISEIAEVVLSHEKKINKDGRAAYGEMDTQLSEMGRMLYFPSLPGNKTAQKLPYFFDEVLALRIEKDEDGKTQRALMCDSDGLWLAKDRSGKLEAWEAPDLGEIIAKVGGAA